MERIAAGEVVERPASVVKELLENALDAGARTVTVTIDDGGLQRVEVSDDGEGIPDSELGLAVERHATSKLDPDGPVEEIGTLGFRGEALAAIGAVGRLRLVSRPPDAEAAGVLTVEGGQVGPRSTAGRAVGTTVEVRDLFFNTPARRKFLKSPVAEQLEVLRTVERVYLARPDVSFRVRSGDRDLANYPAAASPRDAAARVLGPALLRESFDVTGTAPGVVVSGVLGRPATALAHSRGLFFAVNGRAVEARALAQAVRVAFGDYVPRSRFPVGVLRLTVDLDRVDVNVHPTKREVRFVRERDLADQLRTMVRSALQATPTVAESRESPRSFSGRAGTEPQPSGGAPPSPLRPSVRGAQRSLMPEAVTHPAHEVPARGPHPSLALLGCLDAMYWLAASEDGLVLIDQHAASERVVYERLRARSTLGRQALVTPYLVTLSGAQRAALEQHDEFVRHAGFEVERFGPETHRVRTVPAYRGRTVRPEALGELLTELVDGGRPTLPDGLEERTAASVACHAAIRAGDVVTREEFATVLEALRKLPEASYACPHGRPIQVRIPRGRIDRWFLRSGT